MAETSLKRLREEVYVEGDEVEAEETKRHKSYTQILSLLDEEAEEPNQEIVSSLISSLQQELSNSDPSDSVREKPGVEAESGSSAALDSSSHVVFKDESEEVIRHLLEASDDELGIPHGERRVVEEEVSGEGVVELSLCDGLWEFEDETANYYALLQSELFM